MALEDDRIVRLNVRYFLGKVTTPRNPLTPKERIERGEGHPLDLEYLRFCDDDGSIPADAASAISL